MGVYRDNLLNPAVVLLQNGAIFPALLYGVFMAAIYYAFKLYGSFRFSTLLDETIALIEAWKVNPKDFYSHVLPYEKIEEAVQLTLSKQALKVILDFDA